MALRDIDFERLMPDEKAYSICRIDTMKPPSDPECATKLYEAESLNVDLPNQMGIIWIGYDQTSDGTILES